MSEPLERAHKLVEGFCDCNDAGLSQSDCALLARMTSDVIAEVRDNSLEEAAKEIESLLQSPCVVYPHISHHNNAVRAAMNRIRALKGTPA
jgi:hypothetical protein